MSYISFKGVDSRTIPGLLICELPPISKPRMRTSIIEVDGKDGDIINELGYSSYDKTINIGLTRNYDVNQIIKYFSGSGDLIMSNETNKVYKASIYSQIDYNKLLRFRTANIKFHVQPYKYSTTETKQTYNITNETSVTITNSGNCKSKPKITIYGSGTINLSLNGTQIFVITLGEEGNITIDVDKMEAFKEGILKNRLVTGNYDNFNLSTGSNTIAFTGTVTKIEIENYSRWL